MVQKWAVVIAKYNWGLGMNEIVCSDDNDELQLAVKGIYMRINKKKGSWNGGIIQRSESKVLK